MTRLVNRNCVVIERRNLRPIVIGPFKTYSRAVERRDEISEYMLDHTELEDGEDFEIQAVACYSATTTTNEEVEGILLA